MSDDPNKTDNLLDKDILKITPTFTMDGGSGGVVNSISGNEESLTTELESNNETNNSSDKTPLENKVIVVSDDIDDVEAEPFYDEIAEDGSVETENDIVDKANFELMAENTGYFIGQKSEDVIKAMNAYFSDIPEDKIDTDPVAQAFINTVRGTQNNTPFETEAIRRQLAIKDIENKSMFAPTYIDDKGKGILGNRYTVKPTDHNDIRIIDSIDGLNEVRFEVSDCMRIPLMNSGFNIELAHPDMDKLNAYFNNAYESINVYGRELGVVFYLFNDFFIKEEGTRLFLDSTVGTNLSNWRLEDTLISNIKITDYPVIMLTLAALMHPEGYNYTYVCTSCNNSVTELINIIKLRRNDFSKMKVDNIFNLKSMKTVTPDMYTKYQELLGFKDSGRYTVSDNVQFEFEFSIPSIKQYLEYGRRFVSEIIAQEHGNNDKERRESIDIALKYSLFKSYVPYISKLRIIKNGKVNKESTEEAVINEGLSILFKRNPGCNLPQDIEKFIGKSEISHICYPVKSCPHCGHTPETYSEGFYTVDPETTFFIQSQTRLMMLHKKK